MKLTVTASLARYFSAILALMLVVSGAVQAEPVFSFDATPGKLPKAVVPINYSIELRPDAESLALPGVEVIDIEVREPTARLTLNAVNTTFASVTADDGAARADVTIDDAAETAMFTFAKPLAVGAHRLRIEFTARINKFDRGFFFVDYPTDGGMDLFDGDHAVEMDGYLTDLFTDRAIQVIRRDRNRPFYMSLHYNAPHWP